MGCQIVGIWLPQMKTSGRVGNQPCASSRKRGRRAHRAGTRTSRVGRSTPRQRSRREVCNLATGGRGGPPPPKTSSLRKMNHSLRKHLWAAKAANRLAATPVASRLIKNFPARIAEYGDSYTWAEFCKEVLSSTSKESPAHGRRKAQLEAYRLRWHRVHAHGEKMGLHPNIVVYRNPLKFLMVRSPLVGDWDLLLEHLYELGLPVPRKALPPVWESPERTRQPAGLVQVKRGELCRFCGGIFPLGSHTCSRGALVEASASGSGQPPKRRRLRRKDVTREEWRLQRRSK